MKIPKDKNLMMAIAVVVVAIVAGYFLFFSDGDRSIIDDFEPPTYDNSVAMQPTLSWVGNTAGCLTKLYNPREVKTLSMDISWDSTKMSFYECVVATHPDVPAIGTVTCTDSIGTAHIEYTYTNAQTGFDAYLFHFSCSVLETNNPGDVLTYTITNVEMFDGSGNPLTVGQVVDGEVEILEDLY
jgi:hypothetical protein